MNRVASLRVSLLVSLGLVSVACGGTTSNPRDRDGGGSGRGATDGGGTSNGGTSSGGDSSAGKPTTGGGNGGLTSGGKPTTGGAAPVSCTSPKTDPVSGLISCNEGYTHRPVAVDCADSVPAEPAGGAGNDPAPLPRADGSVHCSTADECKGFELGYCGDLGQTSVCQSGCVEDADCGKGYVCICDGTGDHGGECVPSDCTTDDDCGKGSRCASTADPCGSPEFHCQAVKDSCVSAEDCGGSVCYFDRENGVRACFQGACGRPFLVEANARVAAVVPNGTWFATTPVAPSLAHLTASERAVLAEHWTRMGQMEHASIAAFARFSLQLLALGAPPELLEACTQALADETAHTKLCFALASAYAGRALGPGPLDVSRCLELDALADIVELVIAEGCFGETSAALQALEAADSAEDPVIVAAYAQIASDEQRHAELAFRFVRWALERDRASVQPRIVAALARSSNHDAATCAVVLPCLEAVLGSRFSAVGQAASNDLSGLASPAGTAAKS